MSKYQWRAGRSHGADAQAVGEELNRLQERLGGITPDDVVEAAKADDSPMHPCFEWNDSKAAQHHRKWQARTLVRSIVVVPTPKAEPCPMFVHTSDDQRGQHYMAASVIVTRPDLMDMARRHAVGYLKSAKQRVEELRRLAASSDTDEAYALIEQAEGKLTA